MLEFIITAEIAFYFFFLMGLMIYMFKVRSKAVRDKRVSFKSFKSYTMETPEDLVILQNHYNNHFQIPLFYVAACVLAISLDTVSTLTVVLSTLFIISRMIHTYVHLGSNKLLYRAYSFFFGVLTTGALFVDILVRSFIANI